MDSQSTLNLYEDMRLCSLKIDYCANQMCDASKSLESLNSWGSQLSSAYDLLSHMSIDALKLHLNSNFASSLRNSVLNLGQLCLLLIKILGENVADILAVQESIQNVSQEVQMVLEILIELEKATPYHEAIEALEKMTKLKDVTTLPSDLYINELRVVYNLIKAAISNLNCPNDVIRATLRIILHSLARLESTEINAAMAEFFKVCEESSQDLRSQANKSLLKEATKDLLHELTDQTSRHEEILRPK